MKHKLLLTSGDTLQHDVSRDDESLGRWVYFCCSVPNTTYVLVHDLEQTDTSTRPIPVRRRRRRVMSAL